MVGEASRDESIFANIEYSCASRTLEKSIGDVMLDGNSETMHYFELCAGRIEVEGWSESKGKYEENLGNLLKLLM